MIQNQDQYQSKCMKKVKMVKIFKIIYKNRIYKYLIQVCFLDHSLKNMVLSLVASKLPGNRPILPVSNPKARRQMRDRW